MNNELAEIGRRLRHIRKEAGISRVELAKKCNISDSTIKNWENGTVEISALRLANYLSFFQEYGIYVDLNSIINSEQIFALQAKPDKLQKLHFHLKGLEEDNILFYTQPDGLILYFNPQYRHIINTDYKNHAFTLLHLNNMFNAQYVHEILSDSVKNKIINITQPVHHSTIQLKLELQPDLDVNNRVLGIAGFLLLNAIGNNLLGA